ncbi:hypothetical protein CUU66_22495 [Peribacillus deserti]|uniref:Uncharacterized protein n=1 Tax=Peribacillus deserti TaxID=673318 RepID=A0A2N5M023_9BACI|nr:hypothetical protein CUU66_22495 [Peribacillus deserti]
MLNFVDFMLKLRMVTLKILGLMLMFSTFMLISLEPMRMRGALCLSCCLYAFLPFHMLTAGRESPVWHQALRLKHFN